MRCGASHPAELLPNTRWVRTRCTARDARVAPEPSLQLARASGSAPGDVEGRVDALTRAQQDMAYYLQTMSSNYETLVSELVQCRRNLASQDHLIRNLLQYMSSSESTVAALAASGAGPMAAATSSSASALALPSVTARTGNVAPNANQYAGGIALQHIRPSPFPGPVDGASASGRPFLPSVMTTMWGTGPHTRA